jgi:hypothetical protein
MVNRRGYSSMGCLSTLLVLAAVGYFALQVGEPAWRYYVYEDALRQEARFAGTRTDDAIRRHLVSKADSLGLPPAARNLRIERGSGTIRISADYVETVEFPFHTRDLRFRPSVQATF